MAVILAKKSLLLFISLSYLLGILQSAKRVNKSNLHKLTPTLYTIKMSLKVNLTLDSYVGGLGYDFNKGHSSTDIDIRF